MKLKINSFLLLACLGFSVTAMAQEKHFKCGHEQHMQELMANDPQFKADHEQLMERIRQGATTDPVTQKIVYTIPVVFHIVHEYGVENIADEQVYNAMNILNQDFRKQNPDIVQVIDEFEAIAGDASIEFRLATIDPDGNCTNGIEHIYSHETRNGDMYSKLHQWDRSKYMNIWSFKTMENGISGYATLPEESELLFFADGIAILHSYIGSIGTGNTFTAHSLTHEVGHFLGLFHPSGEGVGSGVCGDDGISDTPVTKGFTSCPSTPENAKICNPNIVENYQNFMEYSFCQVMFTNGQGAFMRGVLDSDLPGRGNLSSDDNLTATGALTAPAPVCAPKADFGMVNKFYCEGDEIVFKDASWNAPVTSRKWYFEGGSPATSTDASPAVTFSGLGWKHVKLVVYNAAGSDSTENWQAIHLSQDWADKMGPYTEDFESGNVLSWLVDNPENNEAKWQLSNTNGKNNSKCMKLNNYKDISGAPQYSEDYFYNFRLGGNKDALISPSNDLTNTTGSELIFDYAYTTNGAATFTISESLNIYISKNCGKSWTLRETLSNEELVSDPEIISGTNFLPTSNTQWKTCTVPMTIMPNDTRTRFKFEFNASDEANNLYIDNVRITGTLDVTENPMNMMDLTVYPNPTSAASGISINYIANESAVEFQLLDLQGKVLATETNNSINTEVTHQLKPASALAAGCYYVKITQGEFSLTKKVVVF